MVKPSGASNWTKPETDYLLDILEDLIPFQPEEWDEVKARFDARYAKKRRGIKAIKRRYEVLYRTKEPTGDPRIPSPVLHVQHVYNMINEKMDATRGSPESGLNVPVLGGGDDEEEDDDDDDANTDKEVEDLNGNNASETDEIASGSENEDACMAAPPLPPLPVSWQSSLTRYNTNNNSWLVAIDWG